MPYLINKLFTIFFFLILSPIIILIYFFILCHFVNPIYVSKRVGLNQILFPMYKFRTIKPHLVTGYLTKKNDRSFFYFSNLLREFKLDELPQLLNIIFGQMNWVGPRPNDPRLVKKYNVNDRKIIFSIKPGLTDFSTLVYGINSDSVIKTKNINVYFNTIEKKKINLRKLYVKKKNNWVDLKILILTLLSFLRIIKINKNNLRVYFK